MVNRLVQLKGMSYEILKYLILNNEDIWKLLKYTTPDALSKPNLTLAEKTALIYNGETDASPYRVFRQSFADDAYNEEASRLHLYVSYIQPNNYASAVVDFTFEIMSHNKIIAIDGYMNRNEYILSEIMATLNDVEIGGIGNLFFDYDTNYRNIAQVTYFNRFFQGYKLTISNHAV